jgi:microcin C transport system permease protein
MAAYILRRVLLIIPTMIGIMAISFAVVQFAPGGPVERVIAQLQGTDVSATARITGGAGDFGGLNTGQGSASDPIFSKYRGAQGLDPEFIKSLEKQFGFDKPPLQRFGLMIWNYFRFDFGESYFRDISVLELIAEKLPVSISLGCG